MQLSQRQPHVHKFKGLLPVEAPWTSAQTLTLPGNNSSAHYQKNPQLPVWTTEAEARSDSRTQYFQKAECHVTAVVLPSVAELMCSQ